MSLQDLLKELPISEEDSKETPPSVRALILQQLEFIRQLIQRVEELEAKLGQNSQNSSRPPSSDPPYQRDKRESKGTGKPGAKKGHKGHQQSLLTPTKEVPVPPKTCECGGQGYGPRLTGLIGELSGGQRSSRSAVKEFCQSVLGIAISSGGIQRCVDRVSESILPHYIAIAEKARSILVNFIDETSWYQHGVLAWLWVMVNPSVAFFSIKASRSKKAFEELIGHWAGILVSDGYSAYRKWVNQRQTCLAHIIRKAVALSERTDPVVARFGERVAAELRRLIRWANAPPTQGEVTTWYARMCHLIDVYRDRKDGAGKLAKNLDREMAHLWVFLFEDGVEPTNNRAERALRFAVLWRRMMQGSFNEKGDRWVERILSLRETCRLRGLPTYPVLVEALTCSFQNRTPDASWI